MDRTLARLNIEHFQKLLAKETDETKRHTLLSLLAEEKAKLAAARKGKTGDGKAQPRLEGLSPSTPVRRTDVDPFLGFRIDPSAKNAAAGKCESMRPVRANDSKF
jgi:hypothetical protein